MIFIFLLFIYHIFEGIFRDFIDLNFFDGLFTHGKLLIINRFIRFKKFDRSHILIHISITIPILILFIVDPFYISLLLLDLFNPIFFMFVLLSNLITIFFIIFLIHTDLIELVNGTLSFLLFILHFLTNLLQLFIIIP